MDPIFKFYVEKQDGEVIYISEVCRSEDKMWKTMKRAILSAYGFAQLLYTLNPKKIICNKFSNEIEELFVSFTEEQISQELIGA